MANVNTIKTRILNKYDLLANYTNFTPLKGEICIAVVGETATENKGLKGDTSTNKIPIVGIKVGDGDTPFNELPWIQAVAGDVSTFIKGIVDETAFNNLVNALITNAKLATAKDLSDLSDQVAANVGNITGLKAIVETGDNSNAKLRAAINAVLGTASDTSDKNTVYGAKKYAEEKATAAQTAAQGYADGKFEEKGVAASLVSALETGKVKSNTEAIAGINAEIGEVAYTGASLTAAIKNLQDSIGSSGSIGSQVAELSDRVDTLEGTVGDTSSGLVKDVADLKTAITDNGSLGSRVKTLENEMDVVQAATAGYNSSKTIASDIQAAKESASAANTLAGQNETKISTLIGSDNGKSARTIANEELAAQLLSGKADADFKTLQELATWLENHPEDVTAINTAITSVKQNLGYTGENLETAPATVDARITTAISNLETKINIGNYATTAQLTATTERVTALESKVDTGEQNVSAYVEAAKQAAISAAATDATTKAGTAKSEAIAAAATDATAKANAAQAAAEAKVAALAGEGNTATVKGNAEEIARLDASVKALDYTDAENGVVATVSQTDGKINVTHKKVGVADLADDVFIFYCGNATGYADDMKTVDI